MFLQTTDILTFMIHTYNIYISKIGHMVFTLHVYDLILISSGGGKWGWVKLGNTAVCGDTTRQIKPKYVIFGFEAKPKLDHRTALSQDTIVNWI